MDAERDDPRMIPRRDRNASPLGRGANPGPSVEGGPISGDGIAGQRGHASANAKAGPAGMAHRENEDADARTRE